jgi:hypothetical protein
MQAAGRRRQGSEGRIRARCVWGSDRFPWSLSALPPHAGRWLWRWLWLPSPRACPPSSRPAWRWAPARWPRGMPSCAACPAWRPWAAPQVGGRVGGVGCPATLLLLVMHSLCVLACETPGHAVWHAVCTGSLKNTPCMSGTTPLSIPLFLCACPALQSSGPTAAAP